MTTHENSLISFIEEKESGNIGRRHEMILKYLKNNRVSTAREIMIGLKFDDLNKVRPRLCELKKKGLVFEVEKTKCSFTGKKVSCFALK